MLSFEKEARAELLVKDVKKKKGIYHVQEKTVPGILHQNPMSLLSRSRLYTLKRKYGLSKTFVNVLSKSYQQKKEFMTPVSKNLNESVAVQEIEAELQIIFTEVANLLFQVSCQDYDKDCLN